MTTAIDVAGLRKVYQIKSKAPGLRASLQSLWSPTYHSLVAVDGLRFQIEEGELVGFVGPNGAGKSTTIKMLTGILFPTSGDATVLGLVPWKQRQELAHAIASVFGQRSQLWYHLPPADSFRLLSRIYELERKEFEERLTWLVQLFGIAPYLHVPVRRLSLGERMRCEIAAALIHRPRVVFLDEPTIGLDVVAKGQIRNLIRQLNHEEGVTFLLTSHDAGDIEQVCRRVIVINHGSLVFDDDVATLRRTYLGHKIIDLKLAEEGPSTPIPGLTTLSAEPFRRRFAVDPEIQSVERAIAELVTTYRVSDLTVEEPPLEDVIAAIYAATQVAPQDDRLA